MSNKPNNRWIMAGLLAALAKAGLGAGDTFTTVDIEAWLPHCPPARRRNLTSRMSQLGLLVAVRRNFRGHYTITDAGAQAIAAACTGQRPACGVRPLGKKPKRATMAPRLWALLRARGMLDSETAVNTLADAGESAAQLRDLIGRYLRRWAQAGVVQVSARRLPAAAGKGGHGCKRYVLVKDSPEPPGINLHTKKGRRA